VTIDDHLETLVRIAIEQTLANYTRRLANPEALTYTSRQAATVIGCGARKIELLVAGGTLPRVPHISNVLIPRVAVEAFVYGGDPHAAVRRATEESIAHLQLVTDRQAG
jgi:hypothetical protein